MAGGALLGLILNILITIVLNSGDDGSAMMMTLMGLMLGVMSYIIIGGLVNVNKSEVALMMSQTRKSFWMVDVIAGLVEILWISILAGIIFWIDHSLQASLFSSYELEMNMTPFFTFIATHPVLLLALLLGAFALRILIETLSVKVGPKAFFILWMCGCLFVSFSSRMRWFSSAVKLMIQDGGLFFSGSIGMLRQTSFLIVAIVVIAVSMTLVRKQEVR